jgi:hypothetical protein
MVLPAYEATPGAECVCEAASAEGRPPAVNLDMRVRLLVPRRLLQLERLRNVVDAPCASVRRTSYGSSVAVIMTTGRRDRLLASARVSHARSIRGGETTTTGRSDCRHSRFDPRTKWTV